MGLVTLLPTILLFLSSSVLADSSVVGNWMGRIIDNNLPVVVSISVDSLSLGEKTLRIKYASPRNCFAVGEYAGDMDGRDIFYLTESSARTWCERYTYSTNSVIRLKLTDNGEVQYDIQDVRKFKKRMEEGVLFRKQESRPSSARPGS